MNRSARQPHQEVTGEVVEGGDAKLHTPVSPIGSLHQELIRLYTSVDARLSHPRSMTLELIATEGGEGTSTLIQELALAASTRLKKSVLVITFDPGPADEWSLLRLDPERESHEALIEVCRSNRTLSRKSLQDAFDKASAGGDEPGGDSGSRTYSLLRIPENSVSSDVVPSELLRSAKERFELVLVDPPPASRSPAGITVAKFVDGVILVIEAERTRQPLAQALRAKIAQLGGNVLGVVLNKRRRYIPKAFNRYL